MTQAINEHIHTCGARLGISAETLLEVAEPATRVRVQLRGAFCAPLAARLPQEGERRPRRGGRMKEPHVAVRFQMPDGYRVLRLGMGVVRTVPLSSFANFPVFSVFGRRG